MREVQVELDVVPPPKLYRSQLVSSPRPCAGSADYRRHIVLRRTKGNSDVESKPLYYVTVHSASQSASYMGHMPGVQYKTYPSPPYPVSNSLPIIPTTMNRRVHRGFCTEVASSYASATTPLPRATLNSCNGRGLDVTRVRTKTTLHAFRPKGLPSDKGKYVWQSGVNGNHQFYNESAPKYTRGHFRGDATRASYPIPPFEGSWTPWSSLPCRFRKISYARIIMNLNLHAEGPSYRVPESSSCTAYKALHPPEYPATAAVLGDVIKGTMYLTHTNSLGYQTTT